MQPCFDLHAKFLLETRSGKPKKDQDYLFFEAGFWDFFFFSLRGQAEKVPAWSGLRRPLSLVCCIFSFVSASNQMVCLKTWESIYASVHACSGVFVLCVFSSGSNLSVWWQSLIVFCFELTDRIYRFALLLLPMWAFLFYLSVSICFSLCLFLSDPLSRLSVLCRFRCFF